MLDGTLAFAAGDRIETNVGPMGIREAAGKQMPTSETLRSYQHYIGGAQVAAFLGCLSSHRGSL